MRKFGAASLSEASGGQCVFRANGPSVCLPQSDGLAQQLVVQAAGVTEIPRAPYGDGPLRMVQLGNETVIYSIGSDGQDQKAMIDWNHGQQLGDFIFPTKRTP